MREKEEKERGEAAGKEREGKEREGKEREDKEAEARSGDAMEVEPVLGASVGGESRNDEGVAQVARMAAEPDVEVVGHGFERLEDFESMPMPVEAGSRTTREKMFEGFGLTVDTGVGGSYFQNSGSGYSTSAGSTLPSSTSEYFAFGSAGGSVPSSATTATSIGSSSLYWTGCPERSLSLEGSDAVDAGVGSKTGLGMEIMEGGGGLASSYGIDCEGLDLSQLVGPTLLMPEALEAEFSAFMADTHTQAQTHTQEGHGEGSSSGVLDVDGMYPFMMRMHEVEDSMMRVHGVEGPATVESSQRRHSLFAVSEDVCARVRVEEAVTVRSEYKDKKRKGA